MNPRLEILNKVTNPNRDKRGMEQLSLSESSILSSSSSSKWRIPQKGIFSEQDVQKFRESNACKNIMEFIEKCGASVKGLKARDP